MSLDHCELLFHVSTGTHGHLLHILGLYSSSKGLRRQQVSTLPEMAQLLRMHGTGKSYIEHPTVFLAPSKLDQVPS